MSISHREKSGKGTFLPPEKYSSYASGRGDLITKKHKYVHGPGGHSVYMCCHH